MKRVVAGMVMLGLVLCLSIFAYGTKAASCCCRVDCDVNNDGKVDIKDIAIVAQAFGSYGPGYLGPCSPAHPRWNKACDVWGGCGDNKIDIRDLCLVAKYFGWSCR